MNANDWVGYMEHLSEKDLGIFNANVGKGGFTIFAHLLRLRYGVNYQRLPWCATFVHAVIDRPDILGKPHPGTRVLARRMKRKGLWRDRDYFPSRGDLIFLSNTRTKRIDHCGIVEKCDGIYVTSIEGNAADVSGVFSADEGGVVAKNIRYLNDTLIVGYASISRSIKQQVSG